MPHESGDALMTTAEVAELFRVSPKTVARWAKDHRISCLRTLGGHRRFRSEEIRRLLAQFEEERDAVSAGKPTGPTD
jgi:excisionase family DNA binding protein